MKDAIIAAIPNIYELKYAYKINPTFVLICNIMVSRFSLKLTLIF